MADLSLGRNAESLSWRAVRFPRISCFLNHRISRFSSCLVIVLLIGAVSWALNARLSPADKTGWLHLQPDMTSSFGWVLGIGVWLGAAALCALVLKAISSESEVLEALVSMWRPLVLLGAAAYLLFSNDQGRELGLSLMIDNDGFWRFAFLFVALIYWAANSWHTARVGLRTASERLHKDQGWLSWTPRLLGVCAHLLAAINLSLAAWTQPEFGTPELRLVALTAPVFIVFATILAWALDRLFFQPTPEEKPALSHVVAAVFGFVLLRKTPHERAAKALLSGVVVAIGLVVGIAGVALADPSLPAGFVKGTIATVLSAIVFLIVVSWLQGKKPLADTRSSTWATIGLFGVALLFTYATWRNPVGVGNFFGSMVVVYFAFGAILALVNMIEMVVASASGLAMVKQWFGERITPRGLGAGVLAFAVAFGVVNAWLHPFHRVRLCNGGDCASAMSPNQRPKVAVAARAWYGQAKAAYERAGGEGPVPMLIVATAGGGIRAAYWTATVLEHLEEDFATEGGSMRPYLFAISGVSGGSVGATAFAAALTKRDESGCPPRKNDEADKKINDEACPLATDFLKEDFLAPALASLVFQDAPSSFLPDFGQGDRGTALERSFEHGSNNLLGRPFLDLISLTDGAIANGGPAPPWRPILLLNATHEETGNRIITSHVLIERNVFVDSLDALNVLRSDVRASTAAHNSARFTYVSPAGDLGHRSGSVIDGGYFENFGALSALELANAAARALNANPNKPKVKLVILMISSDPDLDRNHMLVRINESTKHPGKCLVSVAERQIPRPSPNSFSVDPEEVENALINEFVAPFQGLQKVREAHGNWAAAELAVGVCTEINSNLPHNGPDTNPLDLSQGANLDRDTQPFDPNPGSPYFAHLAMCTEKPGQTPTLKAPLGWVLSKATQDHFKELLGECGNYEQLHELEIALGKKAPQQQAEDP
jgi:hypothetical protein